MVKKGVLVFWSETGTEGGFWAFQDGRHISPDGKSFSYDGLHILENGNYLTIFSKTNPDEIIWEGEIKLRQRTNLDDNICGLRVHSFQEGAEPEKWLKWFLAEHPALLEEKEFPGVI